MNSLAIPVLVISLIIGSGAAAIAFPQSSTLPETAEKKSIPDLKRLIDRGRADEAMKELDQMAAQNNIPAGADRLRGEAFYAQGSYASADQALAKALAADPKDREAAQMRGLALFRLGRAADAIPLLEGARETTAQSKADPNYVLALCYLQSERYDDARHAFAIQYGFAPDSASAYLLSARMLFRREYIPVAQEFARRALELEPGLPLAHLLLGEIALAGQHLEEATSEFEKERARNPLEASTYDRLGDAYARAAKYPEAERALQQALLLEPNTTGPYILLGKVLLMLDDPSAAAGYLERARTMDPDNYMTHGLLGQAYRAMGRKEEAAHELQQAGALQAGSAPNLTAPK